VLFRQSGIVSVRYSAKVARHEDLQLLEIRPCRSIKERNARRSHA